MSYFRRARAMGDDAPITHPWQVDESIIPTVPPTRVDCAQLPADSPWRNPGQVCAPTMTESAIDMVKAAASYPVLSVTTTDANTGETSGLRITGLMLAVGAAGYYLLRKKRG